MLKRKRVQFFLPHSVINTDIFIMLVSFTLNQHSVMLLHLSTSMEHMTSITNLHFRLQLTYNIAVRVRPRTLERIEDNVCVCLRLFQQPTCTKTKVKIIFLSHKKLMRQRSHPLLYSSDRQTITVIERTNLVLCFSQLNRHEANWVYAVEIGESWFKEKKYK